MRKMWLCDVTVSALAEKHAHAAAGGVQTYASPGLEYGYVTESVVDAVTESSSPQPLASTTPRS